MSTHHFAHAHDFNIGSLTINNTNPSRDFEKAFQHLYDNIAIDAVHNSAERHDAPKCHEDTRKAVQGEIHAWIEDGSDDDEPKMILWLTGPAGTGKSAIAGSIADTCDEQGLLAGSFFFASFVASETRRSKLCLVATLVHHLISSLADEHPLRCAVLSAIQRDRSVFRRRLKDQFRILLIKPLNDTRGQFNAAILPKVFIIDGLDEVEAANSRQPGRDPHDIRRENEGDQEEILSALLYAASDPTFPFRIVIASRPERVIQSFLSDEAACVTQEIFLDDKYDPDSDIALFLRANFTKVRRRYRLPTLWPSEKDIRDLVFNASGHFIYAATVIRFLQSGRHPNPKALLETLLGWGTQDEFGALASLDALYTRILQSSPDPLLAVQWSRLIDQSKWAERSAIFLNRLLQDYEGQADYLLENLASLIWVPPVEDESSPYQFYHKSFTDFLHEEGRCGPELARAYNTQGQDLYCERSLDILMNKSPVITLPEPQQLHFLRDFLKDLTHDITILDKTLRKDTEGALGKLDKCDTVWWVRFAVANFPGRMVAYIVSETFWAIHSLCGHDFPGNCLPHCKHWRGNIFRACKELGWGVPNAIAFLRGALEGSIKQRFPYSGAPRMWKYEPYFTLPGDELQPSLPMTTTQYTVDEEYQAALDLVAEMYSRLPSDWKSQLEEEGGRQAAFLRLEGAIEGICHELGIETPGVLVSRSLEGQDSDDEDRSEYEAGGSDDSDPSLSHVLSSP